MRYRILDQHGLNFLTLIAVEWIDLFTRKAFADIVTESLRWCQQNKGLEIYALVLMPSHLHHIARAVATTTSFPASSKASSPSLPPKSLTNGAPESGKKS